MSHEESTTFHSWWKVDTMFIVNAQDVFNLVKPDKPL